MNGMIFAAGLGTRLAPLTDTRPKALVEVGGVPLLSRAIDHLADAGVDHIVVNVHHFANQVVGFIDDNKAKWKADVVVSDESDLLLDTGGGLVKALSLFPDDGPVVVGNADVVCNAPLARLIQSHVSNGDDATLMTSGRTSTRHLLFDADGLLCGWEDVKSRKRRDARSAARRSMAATSSSRCSYVRSCLPESLSAHCLSSVRTYPPLPLSASAALLSRRAAIGSMSALSRSFAWRKIFFLLSDAWQCVVGGRGGVGQPSGDASIRSDAAATPYVN